VIVTLVLVTTGHAELLSFEQWTSMTVLFAASNEVSSRVALGLMVGQPAE